MYHDLLVQSNFKYVNATVSVCMRIICNLETKALREDKRQFVSVINNPNQAWKTVNKILDHKQSSQWSNY